MLPQSAEYFQPPQSFTASGQRKAVYVTATIPSFTTINSIDTVPTIVLEFPLTNTGNVSLRRPLFDDNTDDSYILAVRYTDDDGETYRYVLYNPPDAQFEILFPNYESQTLGASAVIEVWANPAETTIASSADLTFVINTITFYNESTANTCFCTALTGDSITLAEQNPS